MEKDGFHKRRFKIKPHYWVAQVRPDVTQVRSPSRAYMLKGEAINLVLTKLFPLLNGQQTVLEIEKALAGAVTSADLQKILQVLRDMDLLFEDHHDEKLENNNFHAMENLFSLFPDEPHRFIPKIQKSSLALLGEGLILDKTEMMLRQLPWKKIVRFQMDQLFGTVGETPTPIDIEFLFVSLPVAIPSVLGKINRFCLDHRIPWLISDLQGSMGLLGPLFIPHETACYECYHRRLLSNEEFLAEYRAFEDYLDRDGEVWQKAPEPAPLFVDLLSAHAALEIIKFVTECYPPATSGALWALSFLTLESSRNVVLKVPRCPACSPIGGAPLKKWRDPVHAGSHKDTSH